LHYLTHSIETLSIFRGVFMPLIINRLLDASKLMLTPDNELTLKVSLAVKFPKLLISTSHTDSKTEIPSHNPDSLQLIAFYKLLSIFKQQLVHNSSNNSSALFFHQSTNAVNTINDKDHHADCKSVAKMN